MKPLGAWSLSQMAQWNTRVDVRELKQLIGNQDGVGLSRSSFPGKVNKARMVASPLWRGTGHICGFVLDGQSYRSSPYINGAGRFRC